MQHIIEQVKSVLADTLKLKSTDHIHMKTKFKEELGLGSMTALTFLMELENKISGFSVNSDTLDAEHLECLESITNYITNALPQVEQHV